MELIIQPPVGHRSPALAQVRRDYDSLTIGAKPFISFLVWPVFSN